MVKDKVEDPLADELEISKSVECDAFSLLWPDPVGWPTGRASALEKAGCWFYWSFARLTAPVLPPLRPPPSSLAPQKNTEWRRSGTGLNADAL